MSIKLILFQCKVKVKSAKKVRYCYLIMIKIGCPDFSNSEFRGFSISAFNDFQKKSKLLFAGTSAHVPSIKTE